MKRTVVWLTERQVIELMGISRKTLAPVSALVREAVTGFLKRQKVRRGENVIRGTVEGRTSPMK
jgi:ribosomal protein L34